MNIFKPYLLTSFCLFVGFTGVGLASSPADSSLKKTADNFMIANYVIGSGGIVGDLSEKYRLDCTVGEPLLGEVNGTNYLMLTGFWHIQDFLPTVAVNQSHLGNLPKEFNLHQNFPNPFNPSTTIEYELPLASMVKIDIYNVLGQRIRMLKSGIQEAGYAHLQWNGRNDNNMTASSGVYFYRITISPINSKNIVFQQTKKMMLVK